MRLLSINAREGAFPILGSQLSASATQKKKFQNVRGRLLYFGMWLDGFSRACHGHPVLVGGEAEVHAGGKANERGETFGRSIARTGEFLEWSSLVLFFTIPSRAKRCVRGGCRLATR